MGVPAGRARRHTGDTGASGERHVEVKGATLLFTLAALMVTFAGFSALLLGVRQAAGAKLSALDTYLSKTVLSNLIVLTGGTLLPPLLALYDVSEERLWRISAVLFGLPMLFLLLSYPHRRRKAVGSSPPPAVYAIFVVFGSAVLVAMLVYVLAGFQYGPAAYITSIMVNFFACSFAFVTALDVILQQPIGPPR